MNVLNAWVSQHTIGWAVILLGLCAALLLVWFPGFNARQRGHEHPFFVKGAAWVSLFAITWATVMDWNTMAMTPELCILWTGLVVWSYGRCVTREVAAQAGGFEVTLRPDFPGSLELGVPAKLANSAA